MAENIKYQINGQLADNTVTVDNKEDMILVPVNIGSANEARIIAEMKAEDSGLREVLELGEDVDFLPADNKF